MILLVALLALTGILLSRRGGLLVILLLLFLAPGHGFGQPKKGKPDTGLKVGTVQTLERSNGLALLRLKDGTLLKVAEGDLKLEDRRFERDGADAKRAGKADIRGGKLAAGQALLLKIKYDHDGTVKKVKAFVYESPAKAKKALEGLTLKRQERRKAIGR